MSQELLKTLHTDEICSKHYNILLISIRLKIKFRIRVKSIYSLLKVRYSLSLTPREFE